MIDDENLTLRTVKMPDELWQAAQEAVKWRRDPSVSYVIRRALTRYVRDTERRKREANEERTA